MSRAFLVAAVAGVAAVAALAPPFVVSEARAASPKRPLLARPSLPPATAWQPPVPTATATPAGTRVVVLPDTRLPLAHVLVTIAAGSAADPPGREGMAAAVLSMLQDGGAGTRSAPEVATALAALGAELHETIDPDEAQLDLTVLARDLEPALMLLGDLVARPRFDAPEWKRTQARRLAELARRRADRADVADDTFMRVLYGAHPYAHLALGTTAAIGAITVDELRRFHAAHYGPRTVTFVISGDVAPAAVTAAVTRALGPWQSAVAPPPLPPPPELPAGPTRLVLVDEPGAPQSELRVGQLGRARTTPDYPSLLLLRMVLGGSFTSRLNQNLRERHGYTYGAQAHFDFWRVAGPWRAQAAVRTDATAAALAEMVHELDGMRGPFTADELHKGRALVEAALVEAFSDGEQSCSWLADLVTHALPLDGWARLPAALQALDVPMVTSVAKELFAPRPLVIVVVGDRKAIEASLRALPGAFAIAHYDSDGKPLD